MTTTLTKEDKAIIKEAIANKTSDAIYSEDGYAPVPTLPPFFRVPILWALIKDGYNHDALKETGRLCYIENI